MLTFKNTPNRQVFISRSVAVVVVPLFRCEYGVYAAVGKRSSTVSHSGKWVLPCGYLDYGESAKECGIREAYEELGLDLSELLDDQPWYVNSDPDTDELQNVTLRYGCLVDCEHLPILHTSEEVDEARWVKVSELIYGQSYKMAFDQVNLLIDYVKAKEIYIF